MKISVVCFSDELLIANSLLSQISVKQTENSIELWVLGGIDDTQKVKKLNIQKITEIIPSEQAHLKEPVCCADAVYKCFCRHPVDVIVLPSGLRGDDLAARLSVLISGGCMLQAIEFSCDESGASVRKPVYSGNLHATFRFETLPLVLSLIPSPNEEKEQSNDTPELARFEAKTEPPAWLTNIEYESTENGDLLKSSELVIAAGRGVGKAESFRKLEELAEVMGGVLGGTRPAVYDGKIPRERMIGSSAAVLSPKCSIVFGASGAAPFLAGVEKSKLLIAVNRDPNALIFDNCDVGVIADCNEFAEALLQKYRNG
ncbi:MAG: hypothetical protein CVU91_06575 [Firmicutes bacterium HGW-Firmicutes-16]|nr:MAG: hypothetical protein CVU91_06575 [Firmicutes bacterium HGW-Firmicutes-16]